jgi:outer membrane biosynthesis protein TonB
MKLIEVLSATVLFLLPAAITPAYAQRGHEEEKQPQQKQQQARPAQQPRQAQHEQQARPAQQPRQAQHEQQARPAQQPRQAQHEQQARPAQQPRQAQHEQQARPAQQPRQAQHEQQARPAQQQQQAHHAQPTGSHGRIPDDRFRASFGREHRFHVNRSDFQGGSRRFQYGGFWFNVLDPWPVGWLYTDDVYVDYINGGYFLCNPVHPGVYISIRIG